jgi:predicted RND superfamily exporter protein
LVCLSLSQPRGVLAFWLLICLLAIPGVTALRIDTSTDSVLDRSDPAWQVYQHSQELFGGDELIAVALKGEEPFDPEVIEQIERLTRHFEGLPGVRRVDSIATVPIVRATRRGELELGPALRGAPVDPEARSRHVAERLRVDRIAPRSLVSEDGRVFAINVMLERGAESHHAELLASLHEVVDPAGGILSGVPVFRVAANRRTGSEILLFAPLTVLIIGAFLVLVFRSAAAVAMCTAPGIVGSWVLLAAMGYLGAPLSITTMILPSVILALGCAYAMHLLVAGSCASERPVLERGLRGVALPVALSGLTTAVGFVSIALVRIDAVRSTGAYGALGVLVVTAVTLTMLPAVLSLHPLPALPPRGFHWVRDRFGPWLLAGIAGRRWATIGVWGGLTLLLCAGLLRVEVETDATRWLPVGNPVRDSYEEIRVQLSGISPVNVVIESASGESVLEPETLVAIDELTRYLESLPEVGKAISVADPLRQIHGGFLEDSSMPLPDSLAAAEQYLLLLESVEYIRDVITADRASANILLRVDDNGSSHLVQLAQRAATWWDAHGTASHVARPTGIMYEFGRAENEIAFGQLRGLSLALVVISAILFAIFRWSRLALVALIPNVIPLVLIFGGMGLFGIPLDAGTVLLGSLALGVAVDDTIHITTGFYERVGLGDDKRSALEGAFAAVLPAILSTTVMISAAFLVLGFSEFTITRELGLLTAGIVVLCLLADITLLVALLLGIPLREPSLHSAHGAGAFSASWPRRPRATDVKSG